MLFIIAFVFACAIFAAYERGKENERGEESFDWENLEYKSLQDGKNFAKSGNFQEAINKFSEYIKRDNKNPYAFIYRSLTYNQLEDYEKAMSDVYSALSLNKSIAEVYSTKALIEWSKGNLQSALVDYDKAISIEPNNAIDVMNRGQVKRDLGDLDGAIEDTKKSLEIDPNNSIASGILILCQGMKSMPKSYEIYLEKNRNKLKSQ